MADFLYVCEFSNGHVKVGRSLFPENRIAQHTERVSCIGVDLLAHRIFECVDEVERREAALIAACDRICTQRHKHEWFAGLLYEEVCAWANDCARAELPPLVPWLALFDRPGIQSSLARAMDVSPQAVNNWRRRGIPIEFCARVEQACGGEFTRKHFRPDDWHLIWPELVSARRPALPQSTDQAAA